MAFSVYNKELQTHLTGGHAFEYLKTMTDLEVHEALKSSKSWDGFREMDSSGPIDCTEDIQVYETEMLLRKKALNDKNKQGANMAFNKNEIELTDENMGDIIALMSKIVGTNEEDLIQSWVDHQEAVEAAAEEHAEAPTSDDHDSEVELVDLSAMTLVDKLGAIVHDTCDQVLKGSLGIESGQELRAMAEAVAIRERLRGLND